MSEQVDNIEFISSRDGIEFGGKDYYNIVTPNHFWAEGRFQVFLSRARAAGLLLDKPLKGLDIGCGSGVVRQQIESSTKWTVDGTELDIDGLKANKKGRGNLYFYDILSQDARFESRYDFIVLFDVIEHIEDTRSFLSACLFHLKPGGYIFINVPALPFLFSEYDKVQGHFRRYTKESLTRALRDVDADIVNIGYWGMTMVPLLLLRKLSYWGKRIDQDTYAQGIKPPNGFCHAVLRFILQAELKLSAISFLGTSVSAIARKKGAGQ